VPRVLQINDYPAGSGGGAEVVVSITTRLLRTAGWEVEVFTSADLPNRRLTPRRYIANPIARRALAKRLADFRPDIVHLHNFYHRLSPGILAEVEAYKHNASGLTPRRSVRVVMTAHDCHLVCPAAGGTWFRGWSVLRHPVAAERLRHWSYLLSRRWDHRSLGHSLLKLAQHIWNYRLKNRQGVLDMVICPSPFLQRLCAAAGQAAAVLPNPSPRAPRGPAERPGPLRLVFVGRLEPEKGVYDFLRILPANFPGTLTLIGDGSDADRCRAVCRRRGLEGNVFFLGRLPHARVLELLGRFHVLVLPSLFLESYGVCVVEALSAGTNVLVTDRGAPRDLVESSGVGHVFTPGDAASLAEQLTRIVQSHQAGTLNRFDVSAFLEARSEQAYLRGLLALYTGSHEDRIAA
jgi:glycosyltransferase involved in cell wall biosynthesis